MAKRKFVYPSPDVVRYINEVVNLMSTRKADAHKLLRSEEYIKRIIDDVKSTRGDEYDKCAVLLRDLITTHGFASGNKRTAFIVSVYFLKKNGGRVKFRDFDKVEKILKNIRLYNIIEISNWLRTGNIDETKFKR
ncbi:MAG: Fic family protein [Candidatus Aenigmarchaeota archaeon]|nr:Fic family protein [Candidatus Aenigmarchaeota archaeon]